MMQRALGVVGFIGVLVVLNALSWMFGWGFWLY